MSKGFIMMAVGSDYVLQACLCAMSIQKSNNKYPISIITNDIVPEKYTKFFDKIIPIPFESTIDRYATNYRWKIYHATPYEETIVLDTDILVLQNLENFWNLASNYELYFVSNVYTYRQKIVTSDYYRKAFTANNLPNLYSAVYYFKKCDFTHNFFKWVELVSNNWELFYGNYCKEKYPRAPSMDLTFSITSKMLDIEDKITNYKSQYPILVHMKPRLQEWKIPPESWQTKIGVYLTQDCKLTIGNNLQQGIFHYTEKNFLNQGILDTYYNLLEEECLIN